MAAKYSTSIRNAMMDAITTAVGGSGILRIYDGTRPANVATAVTSQVILAELTCNATFAGAASNGILTLNSITQDSSANATGTATWFRIFTSGGTACIDGDVNTAGADLNLTTQSIVATQPVSVTSFTITQNNG